MALAAVASVGCTSMVTIGPPVGDDGGGVAGEYDGGQDTQTFSCDPASASPSMEPTHWLHPREPIAGQTVTIAFQSGNTRAGSAPALQAEIVNRDGTRTASDFTLVGDSNALYYFSFADVAAGDNCITVRNGDRIEAAMKVVARSPEGGLPRGNGVWKITANHQWRCDEQPTWGNLLTVKAVDENGAPVEGVTIDLAWTDDTVYPVAPDDEAMSFSEHGQPKSLTTGGDGTAALMTPWGEGVRSPADDKPGYVVFLVSVADGASDVATEITTGIWDSDPSGCDYCPQDAVNTFGHWSHTVEFQRQPDATEACEVPSDHAGQQACTYTHFYHEPGRTSCLPVAP